MKVFVMRHGEAQVIANSDKERQLNLRGQLQAEIQGAKLRDIMPNFDKVLVSPYVRALETFNKINEVYENQLIVKQEIWEGITPYGNASSVSDYLAVLAQRGIDSVLIVSHLPLVGEIVAELCGKNPASFYPSTIVGLEWNYPQRGHVIEIKYPE